MYGNSRLTVRRYTSSVMTVIDDQAEVFVALFENGERLKLFEDVTAVHQGMGQGDRHAHDHQSHASLEKPFSTTE